MSRFAVRWLLTTILVAVVTLPPAMAGASLRHVVIMSVDGLRADALRQVMPDALLARAAYSWDAQTTLPSFTLPAHTSMLTGVGPDVHRVRFNIWYEGCRSAPQQP